MKYLININGNIICKFSNDSNYPIDIKSDEPTLILDFNNLSKKITISVLESLARTLCCAIPKKC